MICPKCGTVAPDGWPNCMDCGAPIGSRAAAPVQGVEPELFPLLAAANLSRRRGAYVDAEKQCADILRRYPGSAAPHSLMGEISEDQGRIADAVSHYQMAVQIDPANEADRGRLARALDRQAAASRQPVGTPMRSEAGASGWMTHVPLATWAAIGILTLVCLGLLAYLVKTLNSQPAPASNFSNTAALSTENSAGAHPLETTTESSLRNALNTAVRPNVAPFQIGGVLIDPRSQSAGTRITVNLTQPLTGTDDRSSILRVAGAVAMAAGSAHLNQVIIRMMGSVGAGPPTLLFIGDAVPASFAGANPSAFSAATDVTRFQNPWWSNSLP